MYGLYTGSLERLPLEERKLVTIALTRIVWGMADVSTFEIAEQFKLLYEIDYDERMKLAATDNEIKVEPPVKNTTVAGDAEAANNRGPDDENAEKGKADLENKEEGRKEKDEEGEE